MRVVFADTVGLIAIRIEWQSLRGRRLAMQAMDQKFIPLIMPKQIGSVAKCKDDALYLSTGNREP
jgi:hypothetical protein